MPLSRVEEDAVIAAVVKDINTQYVLIPRGEWPETVITELGKKCVMLRRDKWYTKAATFAAVATGTAVAILVGSYVAAMKATADVLTKQGITDQLRVIEAAHNQISAEAPLARLTKVEDRTRALSLNDTNELVITLPGAWFRFQNDADLHSFEASLTTDEHATHSLSK